MLYLDVPAILQKKWNASTEHVLLGHHGVDGPDVQYDVVEDFQPETESVSTLAVISQHVVQNQPHKNNHAIACHVQYGPTGQNGPNVTLNVTVVHNPDPDYAEEAP